MLLPWLGRFDATMIAATANLLLGIAAIGLDGWVHRSAAPAPVVDDLHVAEPVAAALPVVTAAIALAGFSALAYEVAWTRLLGLMLGASTYTFSLMLLAFLVGIALGGRIGGPLADRWMKVGVQKVLLGFAAIEVGIAVVSYLLMYLYPNLPFWYVRVFDVLHAVENPRAVWIVSLVIAGLIDDPAGGVDGDALPGRGPGRDRPSGRASAGRSGGSTARTPSAGCSARSWPGSCCCRRSACSGRFSSRRRSSFAAAAMLVVFAVRGTGKSPACTQARWCVSGCCSCSRRSVRRGIRC